LLFIIIQLPKLVSKNNAAFLFMIEAAFHNISLFYHTIEDLSSKYVFFVNTQSVSAIRVKEKSLEKQSSQGFLKS